MVESLTGNVLSELSAQSRRPVVLVIITLDTVTLRYAVARENFTFPTGGNTYTAKAITYAAVSTGIEGVITRASINLDNTARDMAGYLFATPFRGRKIQVWKVFRDNIPSANDYESIFEGDIENIEFDYNWMRINAVADTILQRSYPSRTYGKLCGLAFGGDKCNQDGNSNLTSSALHLTSTVARSAMTKVYDTNLNSGAYAEDFWNYGRIVCALTIGGDLEEREITDFTTDVGGGTITVGVEFTSAPQSGASYTSYVGCPKDLTSCSGVSPWGPTSGNTLNYGGFLHISPIKEEAGDLSF